MTNLWNDNLADAIVTETIPCQRRGRVRFRGSWWPARCDLQISLVAGTFVRVVGQQGIVLIVHPEQLTTDIPLFPLEVTTP